MESQSAHNRLDLTLFALVVRQFREFWLYYLGALLTLFSTHWIQSTLPFYAKDLAEMVEAGSESVEILPFFLLAIGIIVFRSSSRLLFFFTSQSSATTIASGIAGALRKYFALSF